MGIKEETLLYYLAVFFSLVIVLGALGGCAHKQPKMLDISCFVSQDAKTAKVGIEGMAPLLIVDGKVIYYDSAGILHRVTEATCGVR
jgi:hypothetical protein